MLLLLRVLERMESTLAPVFGSRSGFSHYHRRRYESVCQRPKFCLHLRPLNTADLTTEVQQQWLIKQGLNLAGTSRFNDAHHRIDLWLINYCHFHYQAERIGPISHDTTTWTQSQILAPPWLIRSYSLHRLNWHGFKNKQWGASDVFSLTCLCCLVWCHSGRFLSGRLIAVSLTQ